MKKKKRKIVEDNRRAYSQSWEKEPTGKTETKQNTRICYEIYLVIVHDIA